MCHECEEDNEEEFNINMLPEHEREDFINFVANQFSSIIERAATHDILYELIAEWPKQKQAMFTFTTVMDNKLLDNDE